MPWRNYIPSHLSPPSTNHLIMATTTLSTTTTTCINDNDHTPMIEGKSPKGFFSFFFFYAYFIYFSYNYLEQLNDHNDDRDDGHNDGHNDHTPSPLSPPTLGPAPNPLNTSKRLWQQQGLETRHVSGRWYVFFSLLLILH